MDTATAATTTHGRGLVLGERADGTFLEDGFTAQAVLWAKDDRLSVQSTDIELTDNRGTAIALEVDGSFGRVRLCISREAAAALVEDVAAELA